MMPSIRPMSPGRVYCKKEYTEEELKAQADKKQARAEANQDVDPAIVEAQKQLDKIVAERPFPTERVRELIFQLGAQRALTTKLLERTITYTESSEVVAIVRMMLQMGARPRTNPQEPKENTVFKVTNRNVMASKPGSTIDPISQQQIDQLIREINAALPTVTESGSFIDGKLNGFGKRTYPNGNIEQGIFRNGILVTPEITKTI